MLEVRASRYEFGEDKISVGVAGAEWGVPQISKTQAPSHFLLHHPQAVAMAFKVGMWKFQP